MSDRCFHSVILFISLKWPIQKWVGLLFPEGLGENMKIYGGPGQKLMSKSRTVNKLFTDVPEPGTVTVP